jgi:hypothetical protein
VDDFGGDVADYSVIIPARAILAVGANDEFRINHLGVVAALRPVAHHARLRIFVRLHVAVPSLVLLGGAGGCRELARPAPIAKQQETRTRALRESSRVTSFLLGSATLNCLMLA